MGLEDDVDALEGAEAGGGEGGADFGGMVAVVVNDGDAGGFATELEAAIDPAVFGYPRADIFGGDFEFTGDGDGGGGVEHVVHAGDFEREFTEIFAAEGEAEAAGHVAEIDVGEVEVGLGADAVGDCAALDVG